MLRGTLDLVVLALLRRPRHAYGVVQQLHDAGFDQTSYGTVYPLVTRLRRQGLLAQESQPGNSGPAKNVLSLTTAGRDALVEWEHQWRTHAARVAALLETPLESVVTHPPQEAHHG